MALPDNVTRVHVRGKFMDLTGAPMSGEVLFTPSVDVTIDGSERLIIAGRQLSAPLAPGGTFDIELPATDDPDLNPTGFTYEVREPTGRRYNITVPANTPVLTGSDPLVGQRVIELSDVVPVGNASPGQTARLVKAADPSIVRSHVPPKGMWPWYSGLAARNASPCDIMVIGDSISEGSNVVNLEDRWISRLRDDIRRRFPFPSNGSTGGGAGYISAYFVSPTLAHGWTYGGDLSADTQGLGARSIRVGSSTGYLSRSVTCSGFRVYYVKRPDGGSFRVLVDGTAVQTVNTAGEADAGAYVYISTGATAAHTVRIESTTAANAYVSGIAVRAGDETVGIRVVDSSHHGIKAADYGPGTGAPVRQWVNGIKPDVVILELGANDFYNNAPPETFRANIQYLVSEIRAGAGTAYPCTIMLMAAYQLFATQTYKWSEYRDVLAQVAANDTNGDVVFFDLSARWPAGDGIDALDVLADDNVHPNIKGSQLLSHYVLEALTPY